MDLSPIVDEQSEMCKLCIKDLSEEFDYYTIDEFLTNLIESLTGISISKLDDDQHKRIKQPKCVCVNCFDILINFNKIKQQWIENQTLLLKQNENTSLEEKHAELRCEEDISYEAIEDKSQTEFEDYSTEEYVENTVEIKQEEECDIPKSYEIIMDDNSVDYPDDSMYPERDILFAESESDDDTAVELGFEETSKSKSRRRYKFSNGKEIYKKMLQKCEICFKEIEKTRMEGHINKHKNIRPYYCQEVNCGKSFYCKILHRIHSKTIHNGTKVTCDECNKMFPSKRALYAHTMRHKNSNRFCCTLCEKKFNNKNSLKRHLAIHSGIRDYTCEYCSSSFYRKFNLDVHIRTVHHKEKSYKCAECFKKFGYSRLLRIHIQKYHPDSNLEQLEEQEIELPIMSNNVES